MSGDVYGVESSSIDIQLDEQADGDDEENVVDDQDDDDDDDDGQTLLISYTDSASRQSSASPAPPIYPPQHQQRSRSISRKVRSSHRSANAWSTGILALTVQLEDPKRLPPRNSASRPGSRRGLARSNSDNDDIPIRPPRWRTKEFILYYVIVAFYLWRMVMAPVRLSREPHQNYWIFAKRLSQGWIGSRPVDNTDAQFRSFRDGLPSLVGLAAVFLLCARLFDTLIARKTRKTAVPPSSPNPKTPFERIPFLLPAGLAVNLLLHGTSTFKIMLILYINYQIPLRIRKPRLTPLLIWTFNIIMLFSNEIFQGYLFASISSHLAFLDQPSLSGLMPRWHIPFNISMLRLVSFGVDWHWARSASPPIHHPAEQDHIYSWQNYIAYVLYPPLYIAGPIMSFDNWIHQVKTRPRMAWSSIGAYAVRFLVCLLTMELILHFMYVVAIKDSYAIHRQNGKDIRTPAWMGDTPFELAMISFWNLVIVWLKLLLPWRFFRLWALLDGIDPPENMIRCVLNNYSTRGFWRSWHRSYNLWLIRYLYVPIAKAINSGLALLLVFTFVALWHDLSLKLLTWGWAISLFVLPESIAAHALPASEHGDMPWYRHVCALGGVGNVFLMITANTIGFVLGPGSTVSFLKAVFLTWRGILFVVQAIIGLFAAVQIMFEYREEELRKGIVRKC